MFLKSTSRAESKAVASGVPSASRIGRDMNVFGDLRGAGIVRIDGEVGGDVFGRSVTVGEGGVVKGSVFAEEVHIAGAVEGRIEAVSVTVAKSAVIGGTITHNELEIETGANIEGRRPWRPLSYLEENREW
jgi:cytoskeletal protein CcmA (bactofilin family)